MNPDNTSTQSKEVQHTSSKKSVLIAEDDAFQAFVMEKMLKKIHYPVVGKAKTGEDAIQLTDRLKPDIILMDIILAGQMDGITAASEILKKNPVSIIYVTGNADKSYLERAQKTKHSAYLIKPITLQLLHDALRSAES
jgi:two-component system, response regulator PdtaR